MKACVRVQKITGKLDGITIVSNERDLEYVQPDETHDVMQLPMTHPAIYEQLEWEAPARIILNAKWGRELQRKVSHVEIIP